METLKNLPWGLLTWGFGLLLAGFGTWTAVNTAVAQNSTAIKSINETFKSVDREMIELFESVEQNEDLLQALRENDIRTDGQLKLEVQGLKSSIASQSAKIDQLLLLLRQNQQ